MSYETTRFNAREALGKTIRLASYVYQIAQKSAEHQRFSKRTKDWFSYYKSYERLALSSFEEFENATTAGDAVEGLINAREFIDRLFSTLRHIDRGMSDDTCLRGTVQYKFAIEARSVWEERMSEAIRSSYATLR